MRRIRRLSPHLRYRRFTKRPKRTTTLRLSANPLNRRSAAAATYPAVHHVEGVLKRWRAAHPRCGVSGRGSLRHFLYYFASLLRSQILVESALFLRLLIIPVARTS
ncbi:hypothetical protein Sala_2615 [Sphingopyxis alaskensis RB2256]|uniref:Uncharacterized protein n=1 Tax=Sphingopyxis alaskensis (strain DSM 13593 / LMG 18877 / RB2256) TaxID=317655 RepID=Q1GPV1_SPHAL|nr:hypothetical protein Sala_2615 [Sphingopyxis alaskensis RB2256]